MRGWMKDERQMICCCSDGTRPVIFKIDRLDYQRVSIKGMGCENCEKKIRAAFEALPGVKEVTASHETGVAEVFLLDEVKSVKALADKDDVYVTSNLMDDYIEFFSKANWMVGQEIKRPHFPGQDNK